MRRKLDGGGYAYCSVGAIGDNCHAEIALTETVGYSVIRFNDSPNTKFADVRRVFRKTIKRLEKELATA